MKKKIKFGFVVHFDIRTCTSESSFKVSYSVNAENAFAALRLADKILYSDFKKPTVVGFIVNYG